MAVARNPQQAALQALQVNGAPKSFSPTAAPMQAPGNKGLQPSAAGFAPTMRPTQAPVAGPNVAQQNAAATKKRDRKKKIWAGIAGGGIGAAIAHGIINRRRKREGNQQINPAPNDRGVTLDPDLAQIGQSNSSRFNRDLMASGPNQSYAGAIGTGPAQYRPDSATSFADQYAAAMQGQALAPGQTAPVRTGIPMWMRLRDNALVAQQQAQGANAAAQGMGFVPETYQQQLRDLSAAPGGMQRFQQQAQIASGQRGYNSGLDLRASAIPVQPVDPNAEALKRLQR